eukprot:822901-Amphidinium_carterae.2
MVTLCLGQIWGLMQHGDNNNGQMMSGRLVYYDLMHCKHLGTNAYGLASWVEYLVTEKKVDLAKLWALIDPSYKVDTTNTHILQPLTFVK